ncbi:MAG TPA: type II toxin-antitoxin system RelB/DinJ family antitoxin [Candidatus Bathyarchaeia archaeon]|nr:type II toxin-antitoxin system RelB/DinJ family antitoxin [Candidatus Bathyarchaeia archaeon]
MNTAVINIKVEPKLKEKAQEVASDLGFSLSSLINGYLRQLIITKTIHFSLQDEEPSEYLIKALHESEEQRKRGQFKSFNSADEALGFIDKMIDEKR